MSIDNYIWAPAGIRENQDIGYGKYKSWSDMIASENARAPRNQIFLAHGANVLIDEQYFFEDPEDARRFWHHGYDERPEQKAWKDTGFIDLEGQ